MIGESAHGDVGLAPGLDHCGGIIAGLAQQPEGRLNPRRGVVLAMLAAGGL